jgi:hypothetical protein
MPKAHAKHEHEEKKKIARVKRSVRKIDGMEMSIWFSMTIVYVIFVAILSGVTKVYLPDLIYLGKVPLDPQYGVWVLGIALWIPISLMMQAYFKKD